MGKTLLVFGAGVALTLPFVVVAAVDNDGLGPNPSWGTETVADTLKKADAEKTGVPIPSLRPSFETDAQAHAQAQTGAGGGGGNGQAGQILQQVMGQAMDAVIKALLGGATGAGAGAITPICPGQKAGTPCNPVSIGGYIVTSVCNGAGQCIGTGYTPFGGGAAQAPTGLDAFGQILQSIAQNLLQKLIQGDGDGGGVGGAGGSVQSTSNMSGFGVNSANTIRDSFQTPFSVGGSRNSVNDILSLLQREGSVRGTMDTNLRTSIDIGGSQAALDTITDIASTDTGISPGGSAGSTNIRTSVTFADGVRTQTTDANAAARTEERAQTTAVGEVQDQEGLIARLCNSRPWDKSFISSIVPSSFFDGLCTRVGHPTGFSEVEASDNNLFSASSAPEDAAAPPAPLGEPEPTSDLARFGRGISCSPEVVRAGGPVALRFSCGTAQLAGTAGFRIANTSVASAEVRPLETTVYGVLCSDNFQSTCTVRAINPQVAIWAEPEEVRLGARTTIYWNTRDIDSCTVTGPDFKQTGIYGGAGTVALSKAGVFAVKCQASDGSELTEEVVVGISQ